jgi:hypothetical protein
MATLDELEAKINQISDWDGLRGLWTQIRAGVPIGGWEGGEALEYLVIRAFELDPDESATVRYPYEVSLFGGKVEEIDGAVHLPGISCLVESKDWAKNVPIGPIAKMRSQLLRRPAGTIGLVFSTSSFTEPGILLAHFTMPQAILLWSGYDLQVATDAGAISRFLRLKHRVCCENGIPDFDLREAIL